jgi:hypothetical protein
MQPLQEVEEILLGDKPVLDHFGSIFRAKNQRRYARSQPAYWDFCKRLWVRLEAYIEHPLV